MALLKKFISIFFSFILLLFSTELQELIKLPLLFEHYYEHKTADERVTFLSYLVDHYNSIPHTDNDEEQDNRLPFKSAEPKVLLTGLAVPPNNVFLIKDLATTDLKRPSIYNDDDIPHAFTGSIWQPPKSLI